MTLFDSLRLSNSILVSSHLLSEVTGKYARVLRGGSELIQAGQLYFIPLFRGSPEEYTLSCG